MTDMLRMWQGAFVMHMFYKYSALLMGNIEMYRFGSIMSLVLVAILVIILFCRNRGQ